MNEQETADILFTEQNDIDKVKKSRISDDKSKKKSMEVIQKERNIKKWQVFGYDEDTINKLAVNRCFSLQNINQAKKISKNELKKACSFSSIDSLEAKNEIKEAKNSLEKIVQPLLNIVSNEQEDTKASQLKGSCSQLQSDNSNSNEDKLNLVSNDANDTFCTEIDQEQKIYINGTPNQKNRRSKKDLNNEEQNDIPPNLKPYVFHSKDSLTYQILCGEKPVALSAESKASIISDLHKYIDIAADNGLIGEAYYIQSIIEDLKEDNSVIKYNANKSINDIDRKLNEANAELEEQMKMWKQQEETYEKERIAEQDSLNQRYLSAANDLDHSWSSTKKQQMYTKPSSTLLNMRKMIQEMIKTKKFEGIEKLGNELKAREKEEAQQAAVKMKNDYEFADARLRDVYQIELLGINGKFETRMNNLIRLREKSLRPIQQRIENLKKNREEAVLTSKKLLISSNANSRPPTSLSKTAPISTSKQSSPSRIVPVAKVPAFVQNPKLNVPAFCPKRRDNLVASMPSSKVICRPKTKQSTSRSSLSSRLYP